MLEVKLSNYKFSSPLVLASGTAGFGRELSEIVDLQKVGAITTKTITPQARSGNPPPRIAETDCGIINSIGLENKGLSWLINEFPSLEKLPTQIIVSFSSLEEEGFSLIASGLNKLKNLRFLEVNLSCPNLKKKPSLPKAPARPTGLLKA